MVYESQSVESLEVYMDYHPVLEVYTAVLS